MKTKTNKLIALILSIMLIATTFLITPFTASAASAVNEQSVKTLAFWADPQGSIDPSAVTVATDNGSSKVSALGLVQAHTMGSSYSSSDKDSYYYLFLPTTATLDSLKLYFDNGSSDTAQIINKNNESTYVQKGVSTNVFDGYGTSYTYSDPWRIVLNSSTYYFHVVKSSQVGTMYINTASGSMSAINSSSDHTIAETGKIQVYQADGTQDYNGDLTKMTGHGNGTWSTSNSKNSYNIKLASSASLCGMGKAKKWILLCGGTDTASQIKNRITYDFADYVGVDYQPQIKPVDLYCNGHYMGSYELVEKPEIKSNRVDIEDAYENLEIANGKTDQTTGIVTPADFDTFTNLTTRSLKASETTGEVSTATSTGSASYGYNVGDRKYTCFNDSTNLQDPTDITGGYIFGIEVSNRWIEENVGFCAYGRQGWTVRSTDYMSRHMSDYCYKLLYAMGSSVYQSNGNVPSTTTYAGGEYTSGLASIIAKNYKSTNVAPDAVYQGKHWSDILDANSAVTYYWTQEFFKNMDASTTSTYFYKNSDNIDSMVYAGPIWDSDNTMSSDGGKRYGYTYGSTDGWYVKNQRIYRYFADTDNRSNEKYYLNSAYTFYAALAHQNDFWAMAEDMWYKTISPASDILLGKSPNSGRLHSVNWYANELKDSGLMNNIRFSGVGATYDVNNVTSTLTSWISARQTWVNSNISTEDIASAQCSAIPDQYYTGTAITPAFSLTYNNSVLGNQTLEEGTDYTAAYSNNTAIGTATITVTGLGRFVGSTKKITFYIGKNNLTDGNLSIYDGAYIGDTITPTLTDKNALQITDGVTYTWYSGTTKLSTGNTYTVQSADAGKTIYALATGDNTKVAGTLQSNNCPIASTTRPDGTLRNIATFSYKYGDDGASLQGGKSKGYDATSGLQKDTAKIHASVNGIDYASLNWSGSDVYTRTDGTSGQQPVMSASSTTPWQEAPYFDVSFSTKDYSNITFSADVGASSKGAKYYAVMYSVDGSDYKYIYPQNPADEYDYIYYEFTALDKKTMKNAFNLTLPEECNDKSNVNVRIIVDDEYTLDGASTLYTTSKSNGNIALNNVVVDGVKSNTITSLDPPVIASSQTMLYTDDTIAITDTNNGSDIFYTLSDSNGNVSKTYSYSGEFAPFSQMKGSSLTVTAWCESGIYKSEEVTANYTFAGDQIANFSYKTFSEDVINGKVPASKGVYGQSSYMSAVADQTTQYVPLFNADNKSYSIAPDDSLKWSANSGFVFTLCTAGYKNLSFSCKAYTTASGPKSTSLQYSLNGTDWVTAQSNKPLAANGVLEEYYTRYQLPTECANQKVVYIRLATTENLTNSLTELWNNASKGNLYVNDVVFAGESNGEYKMPYTNKSTDYFGTTGTVKYYSPDLVSMQYSVTNGDGKVVQSGAYPADGIKLYTSVGFSKKAYTPYTVNVWAGDDDDQSAVNTRTYYYKGDLISDFSYGTTKFAASISTDSKSVNSTTGTGSLSMYPNSTTGTSLTYSDGYGVKAAWASDNIFANNKVVNKIDGNGYWLIKTSTSGYKNITLSLDQISSNKGPRDWGIAYSVDGTNYSYVANSNARAVSNDTANKPVASYSNVSLPSACDDQQNLYIKVFINGGESVDTTELELTTTGYTGINDIEICGLSTAKEYTATVKTTVLESPTATTGTMPLSGVKVYVDNILQGTTDADGTMTFLATEDVIYKVRLDNTTFSREVTITGSDGAYVNVPMVALDLVPDGYINIRDYVLISRLENEQQKALYDSIYKAFLNKSQTGFEYAELA